MQRVFLPISIISSKRFFDALEKADDPKELLADNGDPIGPSAEEYPFFVLLQNDNLITQVSVTTDRLLAPIAGVARETAADIIINVTLRPTNGSLNTFHFL